VISDIPSEGKCHLIHCFEEETREGDKGFKGTN
jgi:hypothetical protein